MAGTPTDSMRRLGFQPCVMNVDTRGLDPAVAAAIEAIENNVQAALNQMQQVVSSTLQAKQPINAEDVQDSSSITTTTTAAPNNEPYQVPVPAVNETWLSTYLDTWLEENYFALFTLNNYIETEEIYPVFYVTFDTEECEIVTDNEPYTPYSPPGP